ncbi:MAG: small ribosomal subunit Rsm22 family protein [Lentisphaeraceae bacterium]|nr:small ribosomal subunit Rsm22 family protein [Lentisphaeraceae bacterium]
MGITQKLNLFPDWYEEWLFTSLDINSDDICDEKYLKPLIALNNNWLQEKYNQDEYAWDDLDVATSYALYYMTANIPKLWFTLNHRSEFNKLSSIQNIVEFGCGPGTFIWSYLFYLYKCEPKALKTIKSIRGIDHSKTNIAIANKLFTELKAIPEFSHIKATFKVSSWEEDIKDSTSLENESTLAIFGNSLIESSSSIDLILDIDFKNLLILEPGTNKHFQRLRSVRDKLVEKNYKIHFPCATSKTCPIDQNNWCHFNVNRFLLPFMQKMSTAAGRKNHKHHFSAFLFSKDQNEENPQLWRLLSSPRKAKGSAIRFICNGQAVREVVLNKKERSDSNRAFIKADTGSLALIDSDLAKNRLYSKDSFRSI